MSSLFSVNGWWLFVGFSYALAVALIFLRKKQHKQEYRTQRLRSDKESHEQTIETYRESERQLTSILDKRSSMMQVIEDALHKLKSGGAIEKETKRIEHATAYFQEKAITAKEWILLKVTPYRIHDCLDKVMTQLKEAGFDTKDHVSIIQRTNKANLTGDRQYLTKLLVRSIRQLYEQTQQKVYLYIQDVALDYEIGAKQKTAGLLLAITNEQKDVPVAHVYYPMREEPSHMDTGNLAMVDNVRIIDAHYGIAQFIHDKQQLQQTYIIPVDLKAIRPKIAFFAKEDLAKATSIDDQADQAFLKAVQKHRMKQAELIELALRVAKYYHGADKRKSGEPFYLHPVAVATILLEYTKDPVVIMSALLHDTVEDTPYTLRQIEAIFGKEVATIVDEVTHLYSRGRRTIKLTKKASLKNLLAKENPKSLLVKLVDRLHNMQTIAGHAVTKRKRIAQETLDFFIPVAQLLKQPAIEKELRERAEAVLKA